MTLVHSAVSIRKVSIRLAQAAGALLVLLPGLAVAQDVAGSVDTLKVETKLVSLDVVVTDDKGVPVPGLTKDDFTIYQDHKVQITKNFDSWEKRPEIPDKPHVDAYGRPDWGDSPLAILVLDEFSTDFGDSAYAAQNLTRYLKNQPETLAVPTMLILATDQGYKVLQQFTRDRAPLMKAVDKRPPVLPSRLMRNDSTPILVQSFVMLQQIALATAGLRQHKSIIWVGAGFPSIDLTEIDETSANSLRKELKQTVDLLLETKTTVYKIDPVPTNTSTAPEVDPNSIDMTDADTGSAFQAGEDPLEDNFNFNEFAVETGGSYFYGQNDLDRYFKRAIQQTDDFYTLTYRPPPEDVGGKEAFRNIKVVVNKPGLHVVTRTGFYANEPPEPPPTTKVLGMALSSVAGGDMSFSGVGIRILGISAAKAPGEIGVTYQVENSSLTWDEKGDGKVTTVVTAVLVGLDKDKNVLTSEARKLDVFLPAAQANQRLTGYLTVKNDVAVNEKVANVRLIVRDTSGRIGTADIAPEAYKDVIAVPPAKKH